MLAGQIVRGFAARAPAYEGVLRRHLSQLQQVARANPAGRRALCGLTVGVGASGAAALLRRYAQQAHALADERALPSTDYNELAAPSPAVVAAAQQQRKQEEGGLASYKRPWPGVIAGAMLGAFAAACAWYLKQLMASMLVGIVAVGVMQATAVMWASYKGWLTLHWEKILDDAELYSRSKWQRIQSSLKAHLPVKVGFGVGFVVTLSWGVTNNRFHRFLGWTLSPLQRAQRVQF